MTGDEIIALARAQFGEATAMTLSTADALSFLNASIQETYEDLPPDRLKNLLNTTTVTMTGGKGDVDPTWDKIIEVYVDDIPAIYVAKTSIRAYDYDSMFTSPVPIYYIDNSHVWVRPTTSTVKVVNLTPPAAITSGTSGNEITDLDKVWHPAIADLITSMMYAQEEDAQQAQVYRESYAQRLSMLLAKEPAQ